MPLKPSELRERSRLSRESARTAVDSIAKRRLAAHALALAQLAEAIEREGAVARDGPEPQFDAGRPVIPAISSRLRAIAEEQHRIRQLRMRAEELRTTAEQFHVPSAQEALRRSAANFEKLAETAEARLAGPLPLPGDKAG